MTKSETRYSNRWILNLRKTFSERGNRIMIDKIHGDAYQRGGIADYTGLIYIKNIPEAHGRFIAIEFKVDDEVLKPNQLDYLAEVVTLGGIGMIVRFNEAPQLDSEYNGVLQAMFNSTHHPFVYYYDKNNYR